MTRAVLLMGAVLVACPPPPPTRACETAFSTPAEPDFHVAGDELAVTLTLGEYCDSTVDVRASVAVLDPNNDPMPLSEGEAMRAVPESERNQSFGMSTTVKVRSTVAGPYHFTARFEPNLGLVQADVLVAENLHDAGPEYTVPGGPGLGACSHVDVSPQGRVLCLSQGRVKVFGDDGSVVQTLSAGSGARFEDVVWTWDSQRAHRWVETDAGFEETPDGGIAVTSIAPLLAPARDDVLVLSTAFFEVSHAFLTDAGQLLTRMRTDFSTVPNAPPLAVSRVGRKYMLLNASSGVCEADYGDGGSTCALGMFPRFTGAGAEPGVGVWSVVDSFDLRGNASQTLSMTRFGGSGFDLALPTSWSADAGRVEWDTGAVIRNGSRRLLVQQRNGGVVLQAFREDATLTSVTSTWVTFVENGTGRVLIYRR